MARLRRTSLGWIGLGVALGMCGSIPARAQSAAGDSDLLNPNVSDPRNPPRFQTLMKGEAPIFRIPKYGNPPASGAGATGFDSTNARKKTKSPAPVAETRPPAPPPPAPDATLAPIYRPVAPSPARAKQAAADSAATAQASGAIRAPVRRASEDDAFAPVGVRAGAFIYKPAVEIWGGYDTNPGRISGGTGSTTTQVAPELGIQSDWSRHEFTAMLRGTYSWYQDLPALSRPMIDLKANGRIDITSQTRADLEGEFVHTTDTPGNPNNPTDIASPPAYDKYTAKAALTHRFNRFELTAKSSAERTAYDNATLNDGTPFDLQDRNYNQYGVALRGSYELTPGVKPFVEAGYDRRIHDLNVDFSGVRRDSDGTTVKAGSTFELTRKLTGEISVGYLTRDYQDPTLPRLQGVIGDSSLIWAATPLTTAKLTASSAVDESTMTGVSGILRRDVGVEIDHSFRRWLIGIVKAGYGLDDYQGLGRQDQRYTTSVGFTYKMTRTMQFKGEFRQEWLHSNVPGQDYTASIIMFGLRLQR